MAQQSESAGAGVPQPQHDERLSAAGKEGEEGEQVEQPSTEQEQGTETVQEPAKLVRLAYMIHQLLSEVRETELDTQTRTRLRTQVDQTAREAADVLSPDLGEELDRLRTRWSEEDGVSQSELRVEQAQLVGWLEGVLQGIQTALSAEQATAQSELQQLSGGDQQQ